MGEGELTQSRFQKGGRGVKEMLTSALKNIMDCPFLEIKNIIL